MDNKKISDYPLIKDGSKIYLIIKPDVIKPTQANLRSNPNIKPVKKSPQERLKEYFMKVYSYSEEEAIMYVKRSEDYIADKVRDMSLHDIERWLVQNHKSHLPNSKATI